jgi:hypothetical protein
MECDLANAIPFSPASAQFVLRNSQGTTRSCNAFAQSIAKVDSQHSSIPFTGVLTKSCVGPQPVLRHFPSPRQCWSGCSVFFGAHVDRGLRHVFHGGSGSRLFPFVGRLWAEIYTPRPSLESSGSRLWPDPPFLQSHPAISVTPPSQTGDYLWAHTGNPHYPRTMPGPLGAWSWGMAMAPNTAIAKPMVTAQHRREALHPLSAPPLPPKPNLGPWAPGSLPLTKRHTPRPHGHKAPRPSPHARSSSRQPRREPQHPPL